MHSGKDVTPSTPNCSNGQNRMLLFEKMRRAEIRRAGTDTANEFVMARSIAS